ncbi:MAG: ATP-grasp domain-containing protein [Pseudomonadota bacterium]
MKRNPIVVVGTTPDYVARLHQTYPEPIFFVLDPRFKNHPLLGDVDQAILLYTPLDDFKGILGSVQRYLSLNGLSLRGVACFDCEYLIEASRLAQHLKRPFPPPEAITRTRNKFTSRQIWRETGLFTPQAILAYGPLETLEFFRNLAKPIVLKPISGSGSELIFLCESEEEVIGSVRIMEEQLPKRNLSPLFRPIRSTCRDNPINPCESWIVEEFVPGPEFSCDFILHDGHVLITRETGKVRAADQTFGSVLAYTTPPSYPENFSIDSLPHLLGKASRSLGFTWGYFMVDFIIQNGRVVLIEMAPRPGGDSIPDLVEKAAGYDILGMYMDMMSGEYPPPKRIPMPSEPFASINLFASEEGIITRIDSSKILSHPMVKALFLKKDVGDRVMLPPNNYDDRLIGYCIVSPVPNWDPVLLYNQLQGLLKISLRV